MSYISQILKGLSLEDEQLDGKSRTETEFAIYVKLSDFDTLKQAVAKMRIEQFAMYTEDKGKGSFQVRSRMTVVMDDQREDKVNQAGETIYSLTFKFNKKTKVDVNRAQKCEVNFEGSEGLHSSFRSYAITSVHKDRHVFVKDGVSWDVDVFLMPDGSYSPWVRAECEVPENVTIMPDLPFSGSDQFLPDDFERREALKKEGYIQQ